MDDSGIPNIAYFGLIIPLAGMAIGALARDGWLCSPPAWGLARAFKVGLVSGEGKSERFSAAIAATALIG